MNKFYPTLALIVISLSIESCSRQHFPSDFIGTWIAEDWAIIEFKEDSCLFMNVDWEYIFHNRNHIAGSIDDKILENIQASKEILNGISRTKGTWRYEKDVNNNSIISLCFIDSGLTLDVYDSWKETSLIFWIDIDRGDSYVFHKIKNCN